MGGGGGGGVCNKMHVFFSESWNGKVIDRGHQYGQIWYVYLSDPPC